MGRTDEAGVAASSASSACDAELLAGLGEIEQAIAGGFVVNYGAHRHRHFDRVAFGAAAVAAFAVASSLGLVFRIEAKLQQRVGVLGRDHRDVAAAAGIAAAR